MTASMSSQAVDNLWITCGQPVDKAIAVSREASLMMYENSLSVDN